MNEIFINFFTVFWGFWGFIALSVVMFFCMYLGLTGCMWLAVKIVKRVRS